MHRPRAKACIVSNEDLITTGKRCQENGYDLSTDALENNMNDAYKDDDLNARGNTNNTGSNQTKETFDRLAETANQVIEMFTWLGNRLNSTGSVFKIEDARGMMAEVSLSIPANGVGEVTVVLGKMRKSYAAKARQENQEFKRGCKVRVVDVAVSTLYVDEFEE